jgi:hypothetical protein
MGLSGGMTLPDNYNLNTQTHMGSQTPKKKLKGASYTSGVGTAKLLPGR